jgi:prepilin-type N-terminal cleavage/methylation domain-containing protein
MKLFSRTKNGNQKGFTLIEFAVATAISGVLFVGISLFTMQSVTESRRSYNETQVTQQVENASFWICRDIQMSESITLGPNAGFPLQGAWEDIYGKDYTVVFSLSGTQLKRTLSENGVQSSEITLAQSIDPTAALTNCTYANGLFTVKLTAKMGDTSLSRTFNVKKRTGDF